MRYREHDPLSHAGSLGFRASVAPGIVYGSKSLPAKVKRMFRLLAAVCTLIASHMALAADVVVSQRGHRFEPAKFSVKRGDVVHFANAENVIHHVYSDGKEFAFDSGDIPPGGEFAVTFDKPGRVVVRCAIHPQMRAEIDVTE